MKIKNIDVGTSIGASGIQNFFGDGYPYHSLLFVALLFTPFWVPVFRILRRYFYKGSNKGDSILYQLIAVSNEIPMHPVLFSFRGSTHTTKTITFFNRVGNLPTKMDGTTPKEFRPKCIYVDLVRKVAVNNVALSCPGLPVLLSTWKLQKLKGVVIISVMAVGLTPEERLIEIKKIARTIKSKKHYFKAKIIFQLNISCPNTGHDLEKYLEEVVEWVNLLGSAGVPVTLKTNLSTPLETAVNLAKISDALFVTNTLAYPLLFPEEKDKYFYGMEESPLMKYQDDFTVKGPGGVSGKILLLKVVEYVSALRKLGVTTPIILGGGILTPDDVDAAKFAGADAISPGSISMIAPWNLRKVIKRSQQIFN